MPQPDIAPGAPCWIDLLTSDPDGAQAFYAELFGWTYEIGDVEKYNGYITASKDGRSVAGIMKNDGTSGSPDTWTTYLRVEDIGATADAAAASGGQVLMAPMAVPDQGQMAMIMDSSGAAVGLWQFGGHTGFQLAAEPGSAVWHELLTRDYSGAVKFYQDVFGWNTDVMSDTPEFRYTTLGAGEDARAGIMDAAGFLPVGMPANWQVYFGAADADAAVATAVSVGATVMEPTSDTPFGRVALLADPTGAVFRIHQALPEAG
jgi:predicted enzyme related to lactoylglutathione lyase